MTVDSDTTYALARPVTVSVLPSGGYALQIEANEEERSALAEAHGLVAVHRFHADLDISRWRRDGVRISGRISARITQNCVVTLEPLDADMDIEVDALFLPEGSKLAQSRDEDGALLIDAEGPDTPETFQGGVLDAGAVAEEFFELEIDPFPRAPDAVYAAPDSRYDGASEPGENPFRKLSALRDKL